MKILASSALGLLTVLACTHAAAEIRLPSVLAEHMVVQRDMPVHLWGAAAPGEKVHAEFRGNSADAVADGGGAWSLTLPKGDAGGPFTMLIRGSNTIKFSDILVGDVWLIAGQSNVEYPMSHTTRPDGDPRGKGDLAAANAPTMRILEVKVVSSPTPLFSAELKQPWVAVTPATVAGFSAIGYYFARDLQEDIKVPIGMIEAATGGSAGEAWVSPAAIKADPTLTLGLPANGDVNNEEDQPGQKHDALTKAEIKRGGGVNAPGGLFNGMIEPLTRFPIRGVIWYHGASNTNPQERALNYGHLLDGLITDWRAQWGEGNFPFLTVQLANRESKSDIAACRDGQFRTLELPNVGLPVTVDIGDPKLYHPPDKMDIGLRSALWARHLAYHETGLEYSGPLFLKAKPDGSKLVVTFTHADGLVAKGGKLTDWEVAGADGKWQPADAAIQGQTVVASSSSVRAPVYVRYDYASAPPTTLYNAANLPAAPFTSLSEKDAAKLH
jgi:sialate O-acetylesterase